MNRCITLTAGLLDTGQSNAPLPGRDVVVQYRRRGTTAWNILWRGFLIEILNKADNKQRRTAEIKAEGPLGYIQRRGYSITFNGEQYTDYLTNPPTAGSVIYDVLSTRPPASTSQLWPTPRRKGWVNGEAGQVQIDVPKLVDSLGAGAQLVNPYSVLQQLAKTEFGFLFDDREGDVVFRDKYWRIGVARAAQGSPGIRHITDNKTINMKPGSGLDLIYNRVVSSAAEYVVSNADLVSTSIKQASVTGTSVQIEYDAEDFNPPLEDNEVIAGVNNFTLTVLDRAGLIISSTEYNVAARWFRQRLTFTVSGLPSSFSAVQFSEISVVTAIIEEQFNLTAENVVSINAYGVKEWRFPAQLFWFSSNPADQDSLGVPFGIRIVQDYLNYIVGIYGDFTKQLDLSYLVKDEDALLSSTIGDVITVTSTENDLDEESFFIESERHEFTNEGDFFHTVSLELTEAGNVLGIWDLENPQTNLEQSTLYY